MTASRLAHLFLFALLVGLPGCGLFGGGSTRPPAWLARPAEHPACDDALLCGVGTSSAPGLDAVEQARRAGLQEVAASILVDLQGEIVAATRSVLDDGDASWSEDLAETITLRADAELPAARVLETWEHADTGETAVLVGVPRLALVDKWLPELESAVGEADELLRQADAAGDAQPVEALERLARAQSTVNSVWVLANKLRVVANRTSAAGRIAAPWNRASDLVATLASEIARRAGSLRLEIISGDGQRGRIRGHLPAPLLVQASRRAADGSWQPLPGLPLRVEVAPGQLEAQPAAGLTGNDGRLRLFASALRRVAGAPSALRVVPDLATDVPLPGLPEATFHYSLPTAPDTRLLLVTEARLGSQTLDSAALLTSLAGHLGAAGFDVQTLPADHARAAELLAAAPSQLAGLVGRDVDYVLRARAQLDPSSHSGGLQWFSALGEVEAVGLDDASAFPLSTPTLKGAHSSGGVEGALRVLRRELLPALQDALDEQFIVDFLEPHDTP